MECGVGEGCSFVFENSSVDVGMMSLLPVISHSCDSPTLALHKSFLFLLHFLPRPPPSLGVLSPSLSLSPSVSLATCMPQRSLVVPGDARASVRVFSGDVCSQAGMRTIRFQSVQARASEHALGHVHVHSAQWCSEEFQ